MEVLIFFQPAGIFFLGLTLLMASTALFLVVAMAVNRKLANEQRISYLYCYFAGRREVVRQYRRFSPSSKLLLYYHILGILGLLLLAISTWGHLFLV